MRVPKFSKQYKYLLGEKILSANTEAINLIIEVNSTRDIDRRRALLDELVRQSVVKRFKGKLYARRGRDGLYSVNDIPMIKSYLGHFSHANTFNLIKELSGENF